jgi:pyrimidine-specific ribonucleoside hydrolase
MDMAWRCWPLCLLIAGCSALTTPTRESAPAERAAQPASRVPLIDITDLYSPPQDPGDNFDLIAGYALPEIDLKAIVLDITEKFREPVAYMPEYNQYDREGPREPGFIPVAQLNYIFNRNVPCGVAPFPRMRSPEDAMLDAPGFQQAGVELILKTLRESPQKVEILSFGSARPLAVAYNRDPQLLRSKVRRIHLSAGASSIDYLEWNIMLDPHAAVRLLRSDLPIAIYPCATGAGPFAYGPHNSFWLLPNLEFVARMDPRLRRYLAYAFTRSTRPDFLRALEEDPPADVMAKVYSRKHNVWETAVWMQASGRKLVRHPDGHCRILPLAEIRPEDTVLPGELRPCRLDVRDDGKFTFTLDKPGNVGGASNFLIYDRGDPAENERALREALPALYERIAPAGRH